MYPLIFRKVFCEPWAVLLEQHYAIQETLNVAVQGGNQAVALQGSLQVAFSPVAAGLGLTPPTERGSRVWTAGALAVIPVRGIIGNHLSSLETMCGGYDVGQLCLDLDVAAENPKIKRVLVDFHSPGGHVTGVPEAAKQFRALGKAKETFSFSSGESASASYWLSSQANYSYITESAAVGSIGVYLALLDKGKELEAKGHALKLFKAGKHKAIGLPGYPLSAEDEALLQALVDKTYAKFTSAVRVGRSGVRSETMQGQMFVGADAREAKLVDSLVGSLGALVSRLS